MATNPPKTQKNSAEEDDDMPTPKEAKETLDETSAFLRAESHVEKPLEVSGTVGTDYDPRVALSFSDRSRGVDDSNFCVSFDPDTAREIADALERRAEYAEKYAEHRRKQEA